MTEDERRLRVAFQRQREEEVRQTPPCGRSLQGPPGRRVPYGRAAGFRLPSLVAAGALVATVALALHLASDRGPQPVPEDFAVTTFRAPTDFLLLTPGREYLESLPSFGSGALAAAPLAPVPIPPPAPARQTERSPS